MSEEQKAPDDKSESLGMELDFYAEDAPAKLPLYKRKWFIILMGFFAACVLIVAIIFFKIIYPVISDTPELKGEYRPIVSSRLYDRNGQLITTLHGEENRIVMSISELPPHVWQAFVAAEDIRFFEHGGVDPRGLIRAVWTNLTAGEIREGGSTITQQFVKNAMLTQERTFVRKIQEAVLSFEVERRYTKMEILGLYLNQIYFGEGAYGVETAAQLYFGKHAKDLTVNEAAVLASIPKQPIAYNPFRDAEGALHRKNNVLAKMLSAGFLSEEERANWEKVELVYKVQETKEEFASYFNDFILQELLGKYGADKVYKEGVEVYTTLDIEMQKEAERALLGRLPNLFVDESGNQQSQGALVCIEPSTGSIRALVGGRGTDKYNRAVLAERQPGSSFKPFVYLAAVDMGISPEAIVDDKEVAFGRYIPQNYARKFYGKVTLRSALEQSLNVIAVRLNQFVTPEKTIEYAKKMGITTLVEEGVYSDANIAMALGGLSRGVTPLEMASAFGVFANKGVYVPPIGILKVVDRNGVVIFEAEPQGVEVVDPNSMAIVADMMRGVINKGTGGNAGIGRPAAGKTGTTDSHKDAWFVGFTPNLSTAVWIGCDNNVSLPGITGGDTPAIVWGDFMEKAHRNIPVSNFPVPRPGKDGIVKLGGEVVMSPEKALGEEKENQPLMDIMPEDTKRRPIGGPEVGSEGFVNGEDDEEPNLEEQVKGSPSRVPRPVGSGEAAPKKD
jgi:penicillin-binding protein, 1A family